MFGLTRLEMEGLGALLIIAAMLLWLGIHDASVKREALAPVIAATQAASAAQAAQAASEAATQQGNLHDAQDQIQAQQREIIGLNDAVRGAYRLRDIALRRAAAAQGAGSAASSPTGCSAGASMVPWSVYESALDARAAAESDAADLAAYAAGLRISGQLCVRDYEALK